MWLTPRASFDRSPARPPALFVPAPRHPAGGFKAYNDHEWATGHSAKTNPWVRAKGKFGSEAAKKIALDVAAHENRLAPSRIWVPAAEKACAFDASDTFAGARDGWVFKMGARGVGYYKDEGAWVDGRAVDAGALARPVSERARRPRVFFDLVAGGRPVGRIVLSLWADVAPRACGTFHRLVVGGLGTTQHTAAPRRIHYRGAPIDRIVPSLGVFCGAIDGADETLRAEPEPVELTQAEADARHARHAHAGLLATDSADGPLARTARFVLTLAAAPQFDGRRLVYGQVVSGLGVLLELERVPTDAAGVPTGAGVRIAECGLVADGADDSLDGYDAARAASAGGAVFGDAPLDAARARALSEQTVERVGNAVSEGLARLCQAKRPRDGAADDAAAAARPPADSGAATALSLIHI